MVKRFRDWMILSKVMAIPLVAIIVLLVAVELFVIPFMTNKVMENKQQATRQVVEVAYGVLEGYAQQVQGGQLKLEDAQKGAAAAIKALRYSGKEYFWINDLSPKMIMHPTKPELDGKDLSGNKDPNGKLLFCEFAKVCKEKGAGFVDYMWPKPGEEKPVPKVSYVKQFAPWGWIVGSGIYVDDVQKEASALRVWIYGASLSFCLVLLALAISIGMGITRPLAAVMDQLREMTSGNADLTQRIRVVRKDESGQLAETFNGFLDNLQQVVGNVRTCASNVAAAAFDVKGRTREMTESAERVALEASSVATAGEEMAATSCTIASNCLSAVDSSRTTTTFASEGAAVVKGTIAVMSQIAGQVNASAETVGNLVQKSEQIGAIIGTIEDIADQTNLLALNAAIEAARAGEQGRGFAVVADEVRALAERTTKATKEITSMISAIQKETKGAVDIMTQGVAHVRAGTDEASKSGAALDQILAQVDQVMQQIHQIATAAEEQSATTTEISSNIDRITTQAGIEVAQTSAMAEKADHLNRLAEELINSINRFQTIIRWNDRMTVQVARFDDDHKKLIGMIGRLNEAMEKGEGNRIMVDILSELAEYCVGHFKREEQMMEQHKYPDYRSHKEIHDKFMATAGEVITNFENGKVSPSEIMCLLSDWLLNHILNTDKKYGEFFSKKGVK